MLIEYKGVNLFQEEKKILDGINFNVKEGEFIYLIGKVGSGKSSLLKSFYAEIPVKEGSATVLGFNMTKIKKRQIPLLRKQLGIVFQDFKLLTDRTVFANLELILRATGWKKKKEIKQKIEDVLKDVDMMKYAKSYPHELSGGEQQRIAIARAILNDPKIILADEPTGNLDQETGTKILMLLNNISKKGTAVILTTHNLNILQQYPGIVYRCFEGKLLEITEDYYKPFTP